MFKTLVLLGITISTVMGYKINKYDNETQTFWPTPDYSP